MGGSDFSNVGRGFSAQEAFSALRADAEYESGHGGYSGTIAEKHDFTMRRLPEGTVGEAAISKFIYEDLEKNDKWGPAFCVTLKEPSVHKPLTKAAADKLCREKHGTSAVVELRREGGRTFASIRVSVPGRYPTHKNIHSYMTDGKGNCVYTLVNSEGKDADDARGKLFQEKGEWLFYGIASS